MWITYDEGSPTIKGLVVCHWIPRHLFSYQCNDSIRIGRTDFCLSCWISCNFNYMSCWKEFFLALCLYMWFVFSFSFSPERLERIKMGKSPFKWVQVLYENTSLQVTSKCSTFLYITSLYAFCLNDMLFESPNAYLEKHKYSWLLITRSPRQLVAIFPSNNSLYNLTLDNAIHVEPRFSVL